MNETPALANTKNPRTVRVLMFDVSLAWATFWYDVFNVILFVGAFAVAVGTYGAIKMGAVKEKFSDERISLNETETARAVAESNVAKAEAAKAQLELAKFRAPRSLNDEEVSRIRKKMRSFAGQQFTMHTYWDVKEPSDFAKRIGNDALISAGWQFIKPNGFLVGLATGVEVQLSEESEVNAKIAANELVAALVAEGINAKLRYDPTYRSLIVIQIGVKP